MPSRKRKIEIKLVNGHIVTLIVRGQRNPYICGVTFNDHPNLRARAVRALNTLGGWRCECVYFFYSCFMLAPIGVVHRSSSCISQEAQQQMMEDTLLAEITRGVYTRRKVRKGGKL